MDSRSRSDIEETIDRICHRKMAKAQVKYAEARQKIDHYLPLVQKMPEGEERGKCLAVLAAFGLSKQHEYEAGTAEVEALRKRLTKAYAAWLSELDG